MNYNGMMKRYVYGLIRNKGIGSRFWLKETAVQDPYYRRIISELKEMHKEGSTMSPELIADRLNRALMDFDNKAPRVYATISEAMGSDVSPLETKELYEALMRHHVYTEAKNVLTDLSTKMDNPTALNEALERMRGLKSLQPEKEADLGQQLSTAISEATEGKRGLLPFGIPTLDKALAGFNRGEVEIIAGRPGHGKTSFACQLVLNWLAQGFRVMIISKEMTSSRLIHKLIVNQVDELTSDDMKRGDLNDDQKRILRKAAADMQEKYANQLFIHDDVYDSHRTETLVAKYMPDVVIDDFIQLSHMDEGNIRLEILRIMKHCKEIAKTYNLSYVALSQLNRGIENREDPRPRLSDLAESGALEQLAADVLFIFYPFKHDYESPRSLVEIIASKTRYGETCRVPLHFNGDHMRYREAPRINTL